MIADLRQEELHSILAGSEDYVLYSKPGNHRMELHYGSFNTFPNHADSIAQLIKKSGFLIAPFSKHEDEAIRFMTFDRPGFRFELDFLNWETLNQVDFDCKTSDQNSTAYEAYSMLFDRVSRSIERREIDKIVISRVACYKSSIAPLQLFYRLVVAYPEAMVYFAYCHDGTLWLGASPELLLNANETHVETMSLAGTRAVGSDQTIDSWQAKESDEQAFVTDYIESVLTAHGIVKIKKSARETAKAGQLAHLRTRFLGETTDKTRLEDLITALHPTPAVCGTPTEVALQILNRYEKHDRSYYAGYFGLLNYDKKNAELYVNLRCAKWLGDGYRLYAGGGITDQSDLQAEWTETEKKLSTIRRWID